jgi:hypothetical protein
MESDMGIGQMGLMHYRLQLGALHDSVCIIKYTYVVY